MIAREILNALYGAFLLMRFDVAGRNYFNYTVTGVWRSFSAVIVALPVFLGVIYMHTRTSQDPISLEVQQSIFRYATGWLVYPLVALVLV